MKALIVGASGQVGQALVAECAARGWSWRGTFHGNPVGGGLARLDLADLEAVVRAVREAEADAVFLPSGWTWVDGCERDPERALLLNALAPEAAARACAAAGSRLVCYSTDYLFGERGGPHSEDAQPEPLGAYGRSKLEGEIRVRAALPGALILRTTVVYGPEPQGKNSVYQVLAALRAGRGLALPMDQVTTVTYNRDLARASLDLVEGGRSGVLNVAGPQRIDRYAFGVLAARTFGLDAGLLRPVRTADLAQASRRPLDSGLDCARLGEALSWRPSGPGEGLERMRAELASHGG